MSTEAHKATIRRVFEEMDRGNFAVLADLCAPGYVVHFPGMPEPMPRESIMPFWQSFYAAFPDLRHTVEDLIAENDKVACRLTIRGTHQNDFQGIPATGNVITMSAINCFRFVDDKVAEHWSEYDAMGMMQQLGVIPAPASA
ncbi:MAG TPA: ester cyclase [Roseiflexaceae bacterium]|jgi:steroid delta-isomerase-like uncharacterized protein|nr:ester cyclase [Roseiflexaceae bacterium]